MICRQQKQVKNRMGMSHDWTPGSRWLYPLSPVICLASVNTAILVSRMLHHTDIRRYGSGECRQDQHVSGIRQKGRVIDSLGGLLKAVLGRSGAARTVFFLFDTSMGFDPGYFFGALCPDRPCLSRLVRVSRCGKGIAGCRGHPHGGSGGLSECWSPSHYRCFS